MPRPKSSSEHLRFDAALQRELRSTVQLRPVCVATVLRRVQAAALTPEQVTTTLVLDESVHIAASEGLLTTVIRTLLQRSLELVPSAARLFLRCRSEAHVVAVEIEAEAGPAQAGSCQRQTTASPRLTSAEHAVAAMDGELRMEHQLEHGCTFCLLFPPTPRRPLSVPPRYLSG